MNDIESDSSTSDSGVLRAGMLMSDINIAGGISEVDRGNVSITSTPGTLDDVDRAGGGKAGVTSNVTFEVDGLVGEDENVNS